MNTSLTLFCVATVVLGILFSAPKYDFMLGAYATGTPYRLFPWMKHPPVSKSSPIVLLIHVTTAISHLITTSVVFYQRYRRPRRSCELQKSGFFVSHLFFVMPIAMNLHHFAALSSVPAALLNGSLLFAALFLFNLDEKKLIRDFAYFVVISIPVWFEFACWLLIPYL